MFHKTARYNFASKIWIQVKYINWLRGTSLLIFLSLVYKVIHYVFLIESKSYEWCSWMSIYERIFEMRNYSDNHQCWTWQEIIQATKNMSSQTGSVKHATNKCERIKNMSHSVKGMRTWRGKKTLQTRRIWYNSSPRWWREDMRWTGTRWLEATVQQHGMIAGAAR